MGYLATIAQAGFGVGTPAAGAWREAQRPARRHDTPEAVLAAVRTVRDAVASRPGAAATRGLLEGIDERLAYLSKRVDPRRYATFVAQGSPIGSGIVERANTLVVEARLKGAGRHWAPAHVNPLLALRTIACSDRWEEAWPESVPQVRAQQRGVAAQRRATRRAALLSPVPTSSPVVASAVASAGAVADSVAERPAATPSSGPPAGPALTPAAPRASGPRRPAANHPWRRPAVLPKPRAAAA